MLDERFYRVKLGPRYARLAPVQVPVGQWCLQWPEIPWLRIYDAQVGFCWTGDRERQAINVVGNSLLKFACLKVKFPLKKFLQITQANRAPWFLVGQTVPLSQSSTFLLLQSRCDHLRVRDIEERTLHYRSWNTALDVMDTAALFHRSHHLLGNDLSIYQLTQFLEPPPAAT